MCGRGKKPRLRSELYLSTLADAVLGQIFDWIYGKLVGFFSEFFEMMNMMGAELFDLPWTQAVVLFFSRFAWMLYAVGLVVAGF